MATFNSFQDLKVWQDSRELNRILFTILNEKDQRKYGFLINHVFKTAGSIMDNIAEGHERGGNKEFIYFLSISKGSAGELRSQLIRSLDVGLIDSVNFKLIEERIISISSQLSLFIKYLKNSDFKGSKFKEPKIDYTENITPESFINVKG